MGCKIKRKMLIFLSKYTGGDTDIECAEFRMRYTEPTVREYLV